MADEIDDIIRASRRAQHGRRKSAVRLLVEEKYDDLVAVRPDWADLANRLNATGMRDAYGRKLTARHLTQTFYLVSKARRQTPPRTGTRPAAPRPEPADEPFQIRSINPKETP